MSRIALHSPPPLGLQTELNSTISFSQPSDYGAGRVEAVGLAGESLWNSSLKLSNLGSSCIEDTLANSPGPYLQYALWHFLVIYLAAQRNLFSLSIIELWIGWHTSV